MHFTFCKAFCTTLSKRGLTLEHLIVFGADSSIAITIENIYLLVRHCKAGGSSNCVNRSGVYKLRCPCWASPLRATTPFPALFFPVAYTSKFRGCLGIEYKRLKYSPGLQKMKKKYTQSHMSSNHINFVKLSHICC